MLLFLSKTSINYFSLDNSKNKPTNLKTTELCLETIKDLISKGLNYYKNDIRYNYYYKRNFQRKYFKKCYITEFENLSNKF